MNVIKIVVNELPTNCIDCQFHQILDYVGAHHCTGKPRTITHDKHGDLSRPDWCPLEVEEVCEWVMRSNGIAENPHNNIITLSADGIERATFCSTCGKRIKYVESVSSVEVE